VVHHGRALRQHRLLAGGHSIELTELGATLMSWRAPSASGETDLMVLGFPSIEHYLGKHPYFGSTVGRSANRIARGRFELAGKAYQLECNDGAHHLHGGSQGFHHQPFTSEAMSEPDRCSVQLLRTSPDGEAGYPAKLEVAVRYTLHDSGTLAIDYDARCDGPTVVNLTNHSYFNLRDGGVSSVLAHELEINAHEYLEIDGAGIPTGRILQVEGTPLDFRRKHPLGARIGSLVESRGGYDHCYVLAAGVPRVTSALPPA